MFLKKMIVLSCFVLSMACMINARPNQPTSAQDLPIESLVQNYDGKELHKQGNISCWRSGGDKEPVLSMPIFKYCMYEVISNTTEGVVSEYNYDVGKDDHIDKVFAINPKQTIIFFANKTNFGSEEETTRYFLCNRSGCNVPRNVQKFVEYNATLDVKLPEKIAKDIIL